MKKAWVILLGIGAHVACGSTGAPTDTTAHASAAHGSTSATGTSSTGVGGSGGAGGGIPDCYATPMTHVELINACTDAEAVDKVVSLPLLNGDGTLPPLP